MDCILFRHGIAMDPSEWDGPEPERPLTAKGQEKTKKAVAGLLALDVVPTHLLTSPFVRARDTAKLIREGLPQRIELQERDELLPDARPDKLIQLLDSLPSNTCVICVGHEPHLGELAGWLVFGKPMPGLALKKAGACCIGFEGAPKPGQGQLRWWLTPAQFRQLGKV